MALTKIGPSGFDNISTDKIATDAITEAKIADAAVENEHLNTNVITGQSEISEKGAVDDVILVYDTSTGTLKKITAANINLGVPTITSITPTNVDSKDSATTTTFTVTGTNFYPGTTAKLKNNSGSDITFNTVTRDSNTQLTCVLNNALVTAVTDEPYDISVTSSFGTSTLDNQINVDQRPVFVTASGSVYSSRSVAVSVTIEATDPESAGAVRYDLVAGALPASVTLDSSTGVISGTASAETSDTTYNFTIQASDVDSNVSLRDFSITLLGPQITSFTASGTFSVPIGITAVDVLVVAGGGASGSGAPNSGGSSFSAGGGGGGGLLFRPAFTVTPGGTVSVTVGDGGSYSEPSPQGASGQDSVFGTLTAKGGGGGGGRCGNSATAGVDGGNGGGGGSRENSGQNTTITAGAATQPTQPGDSGTYGFGNPGGQGRHFPSGISYGGGGGGGAGAGGYTATVNPAPNVNPAQQGQGGVNGFAYPQAGVAAGAGGVGRSYTIADGTTPVFYAGGGSGGGHNDINNPGLGGGVQGRNVDGSDNRGGGGGAARSGGKGIVIVKF